jgi:hypothetical protein
MMLRRLLAAVRRRFQFFMAALSAREMMKRQDSYREDSHNMFSAATAIAN